MTSLQFDLDRTSPFTSSMNNPGLKTMKFSKTKIAKLAHLPYNKPNIFYQKLNYEKCAQYIFFP